MTHSEQSMNPDGGDGSVRETIQPALDQNLMAQILDSDNMQRAWKRVKSNQGAPGIDGMALEDFPAFACEHWSSIRQSLLEGNYQPAPVRRVAIPKRDGSGERLLGVSTMCSYCTSFNESLECRLAADTYGCQKLRYRKGAVHYIDCHFWTMPLTFYRHPHDSRVAGTQGCKNDYDLYPCLKSGWSRSPQPTRLIQVKDNRRSPSAA